MKICHLVITSDKRELNYYNASYGIIFWDENNNIITSIHENDGEFREEYMSSLFTHFDIEVIYHEDKPDWISDEELTNFGIE